MRLLLAMSLAVAATLAPAASAAPSCTGTKLLALCSEAGCTDLCYWDVWIECEIPKADPVCALVDPTR